MKKIKAIIVDDEMLIRKLIRMKMETDKLNIEIVGEYSDTKSALQAVEQLKPQIILSDICIPGEDGITFSEKCVKQYPGIKVIIITGYNDFDYARRSLKAGVYDYLMKPVQGEELNSTLQKVCQEIREEEEKAEKQRMLQEEVESNLPALRKLYMNQLMFLDETDNHIEEKLITYGIKVNKGESQALQLCLITIKECLERPDLVSIVQKETEEFFGSEKYVHVVGDSWGRTVVISNSSEFPMRECIHMMIPMIQSKYECHLVTGISNMFHGWSDMRKAYKDVLTSVQKQHGNRKSDVWAQIEILYQEKDYEGIREYGSILTEQLIGQITPESLNLFMQQIYSDAKVRMEDISCSKYIEKCKNKQELKWWIDNFITEYVVKRECGESNGVLVQNVITYMTQHISHPDMNLNYLADQLQISSSHLSRIIKQYTGKKYGDLLSDFRIVRMIYLMNNTKLKDKEIGEQIGIPDAHYLSIWFRKMTGCSVSEYRKHNR